MLRYSVRMVNRTDTIASFAKGLKVLECFGAERARLTVAEVAQATALDRATARRCLLTLWSEGYAEYDGKFFRLTPRALRLGMAALSSQPLSHLVQPWLDQITDQIGESCSVSVLDGTDVVYLARAAQRRVMSIGLMPGSRLPAHCTSMGRVLLASLPEDEAWRILEASDLSPRTPYSATDPKDIMARLVEVREQGFAVIDQEVEIGLLAVALPVFSSAGEVIAALNTGMSRTQAPTEEFLSDYLPVLKKVQIGLRRIL